ncbi:MAG: hypothetical protein FWF59_06925 [Turicibacter sp.]|nr:hypothetical protein [Turicibacter sp.]
MIENIMQKERFDKLWEAVEGLTLREWKSLSSLVDRAYTEKANKVLLDGPNRIIEIGEYHFSEKMR